MCVSDGSRAYVHTSSFTAVRLQVLGTDLRETFAPSGLEDCRLVMMGLLLKRGSDSARGEFEETKKVVCHLKASGARTQIAVGVGVRLANTDFIDRFAGIETFLRVPTEEQKRFCSELSDLELRLRTSGVGMALGVGLYRIWLTDLLAGRRNMAELLGEELTELIRKASAA